MRCINELKPEELRGKKVLVRAGFDLSLDLQGNVEDVYRIERGLPTLTFLIQNGAKVVILSHIGREPSETNEPVFRVLKTYLPVHYIPDLLGHAARSAIEMMRDSEVVLLENLRRDPREVANDDGFARELAALGDIYVDDAFSATHRAHASIVGVPKYLPHYAGMLLRDEVAALGAARMPHAPSFAILGGAKFETKTPLIGALLSAYDHVYITGVLANDAIKAQGHAVGASRVSAEAPTPDVLANPVL